MWYTYIMYYYTRAADTLAPVRLTLFNKYACRSLRTVLKIHLYAHLTTYTIYRSVQCALILVISVSIKKIDISIADRKAKRPVNVFHLPVQNGLPSLEIWSILTGAMFVRELYINCNEILPKSDTYVFSVLYAQNIIVFRFNISYSYMSSFYS
jgi:hypothetical protein